MDYVLSKIPNTFSTIFLSHLFVFKNNLILYIILLINIYIFVHIIHTFI